MADNGDGVLEAVRTLRRCLERAINFSTKYPNCALDTLQHDELVELIERAAIDHKTWDSEYHAALQILVGANPFAPEYPFPESWYVDISTPQIAFCAFVDCFAPGGHGYEAYIFGGGDNHITDEKTPANITLEPNTFRDVDWSDLEANQPHNWSGVFDDSIVREWRRVLSSIVAEERNLTRARLDWTRTSNGGDGIKLRPRRQKILDLIAKTGHRLQLKGILAGLTEGEIEPSEGVTKEDLSTLVEFKLINNRTDGHGKGYGLPNWT